MQRIGGTAICHRHAASSDNPGRTTPCKPTNLPKDCSCPAQRPRRRSNNCAFSYISCHAAAARRQRSRTRGRVASSRSEEHTSELQSLMRISYAVFFLKQTNKELDKNYY